MPNLDSQAGKLTGQIQRWKAKETGVVKLGNHGRGARYKSQLQQ